MKTRGWGDWEEKEAEEKREKKEGEGQGAAVRLKICRVVEPGMFSKDEMVETHFTNRVHEIQLKIICFLAT